MNKYRIVLITILLIISLSACVKEEEPVVAEDSFGVITREENSNEKNEESIKTMYVTSEEGLMFRKEPGTDQESIGCLNFGEEIQVEKIEGGWAYTTVDGQSGWCYAKFLTENKDEIESGTKENGNLKDSILGIWQTEDGDISYEVLEDGTLLVRSQYGEDTCKWSADGNEVLFTYSDDAGTGFSYDAEKDILVNTFDESSQLFRDGKKMFR